MCVEEKNWNMDLELNEWISFQKTGMDGMETHRSRNKRVCYGCTVYDVVGRTKGNGGVFFVGVGGVEGEGCKLHVADQGRMKSTYVANY